MLKIQFADHRQQAFWVMQSACSIGSALDNNLVISDPSVAKHHARLLTRGDGFILKTTDDQHEVRVNGSRVSQSSILCGDSIRIGEVDLDVVDPLQNCNDGTSLWWSLIAESGWFSGHEFPLEGERGKTLVLGRAHDCDVAFAGTWLSRKHAEITLDEKHLRIRDLHSRYGTFVNGQRVDEADLCAGDILALDNYRFRVFGRDITLPTTCTTTGLAPPPKSAEATLGAAVTDSQQADDIRDTGHTQNGKSRRLRWLAGLATAAIVATASLLALFLLTS